MGFFDKLIGGGGGDKKGGGGGGNNNPLAALKIGGPRKFGGQGQSLGGSKPGKVLRIVLPNPGPLGIKVEKRPNGQGSIVSLVVAGSQAEAAGLQRGDILCFDGSNGQEEILYEMFLELARSTQRPLSFEARRIDTGSKKPEATASEAVSKKGGNSTAEAFNRRQAVIAAAEAREKAHKKKTKPIKARDTFGASIDADGKKRLLKTPEEQRQLEQQRLAEMEAQAAEPLSYATKKARDLAKADEARLANELGYNPYEPASSSAGQARNATTTTIHGAIAGSAVEPASIPQVAPPSIPVAAAEEDKPTPPISSEFEEAYSTLVTMNEHSIVVSSFTILRKLLSNATTKGQRKDDMDASAKFRRVRLENPKIKAATVDVTGAIELMISAGFHLQEQDGESCLVYPYGTSGPGWLPAALSQMEQYCSS